MSGPLTSRQAALRCMRIEGLAILAAASRITGAMDQAVDLILSYRSKVVATGIGKSGLVARKLAATLCATGQPAVYLHPVDALHGDLGVLDERDVLLVISRGGATPELLELLDLRPKHSRIGIIGTRDSPLAAKMNVLFDAAVEEEADHLGLVPTASTVVAMAIGDALACALMRWRAIKPYDLDWLHPAGRGGP